MVVSVFPGSVAQALRRRRPRRRERQTGLADGPDRGSPGIPPEAADRHRTGIEPAATPPAHSAAREIELSRLEAEARYHRDRLALYRARVLTARPASATRLRELQRIANGADARLRQARRP